MAMLFTHCTGVLSKPLGTKSESADEAFKSKWENTVACAVSYVELSTGVSSKHIQKVIISRGQEVFLDPVRFEQGGRSVSDLTNMTRDS